MPNESEHLEKSKLAVPLRGRNRTGRDFIDAFEAGDHLGLDHEALLAAARKVELGDRNKPHHIVLKVSYIIVDPEPVFRVAVFNRKQKSKSNPRGHRNKTGNSVILSAGIENEFSLKKHENGWLINPYYPLSHKLGAYLSEVELPLLYNQTRDYIQRYSLFVFRRDGERHYAFYIHVAVLNHPNRFPVRPRALVGTSKDEFKGFIPLPSVRGRRIPDTMSVDHCALAILAGETPCSPTIFWRSMIEPVHFRSRVELMAKNEPHINVTTNFYGRVEAGNLQTGAHNRLIAGAESAGIPESLIEELREILAKLESARETDKPSVKQRLFDWVSMNSSKLGNLAKALLEVSQGAS